MLNVILGGCLGACWGRLGASWGRLGGRLGDVLGRFSGFGASWGRLGASWGRLGGVLGTARCLPLFLLKTMFGMSNRRLGAVLAFKTNPSDPKLR